MKKLTAKELALLKSSNVTKGETISRDYFQSLLSKYIKYQLTLGNNAITLSHIVFPDSELLSSNFLPDRLTKELYFFKNQFYGRLVFINVVFEQDVVFDGCSAPEPELQEGIPTIIKFINCEFRGQFSFINDGEFNNMVLSFQDCIFDKRVYLEGLFKNASITFCGGTFNGMVDLSWLHLENSQFGLNDPPLEESNLTINNILIFPKLLSGTSTVGVHDVELGEKAQMRLEVSPSDDFENKLLERSPFRYNFSFLNSHRTQPVLICEGPFIDEASIEAETLIRFSHCSFEENSIKLKRFYMPSVKIDDGTYKGFVFENCDWGETSTPKPCWLFRDLQIRDCGDLASRTTPEILNIQVVGNGTVGERLKLLESKKFIEKISFGLMFRLNEGEQFDLDSYRASVGAYYRNLKEKYAILKLAAKKSGDERLSSEFHFSQLYWENKEYISLGRSSCINSLYYYLCGYGQSIVASIFWYCVALIVFYLLYKILLQTSYINFLIPFELSFGASTVLFNPNDILNEFINSIDACKTNYHFVKPFILVLFFVQKVIQTFLLIEAGLAIRNRVKK